jgi:hypothetical protein
MYELQAFKLLRSHNLPVPTFIIAPVKTKAKQFVDQMQPEALSSMSN